MGHRVPCNDGGVMADGILEGKGEEGGLRKAGKLCLDLLFPRCCPVCHLPAPPGEGICPACRDRLPRILTARCRVCGKPVESGERICRDCGETPHFFSKGKGVFLYDETMRKTMSFFKYKGRREYGEALGEEVFREARSDLLDWGVGVVLPVPIHKDRLLERGYNQAEVLASRIAALSGLPLLKRTLLRVKRTPPLKNLTPKERREALASAMELRGPIPKVPALLVDDIYTTGATLDAAAGLLLSAGVPKVFFLTVCIGGGFMVQY